MTTSMYILRYCDTLKKKFYTDCNILRHMIPAHSQGYAVGGRLLELTVSVQA